MGWRAVTSKLMGCLQQDPSSWCQVKVYGEKRTMNEVSHEKNRQRLCSLSGFVPSLVVEPSRMKDVLGHGPTAPLRLVAHIKTGTWEHQSVPSAPGSASSGLENTARKALPSAKCLQVLPGVPRRGDPWLSISHARHRGVPGASAP